MNERKCDLCNERAVHFASPVGNPDEPALCTAHFNRMKGGEKVPKGGRKTASEALGIKPFHDEVERVDLGDLLNDMFTLHDAKVVEAYKSEYGEHDFVLLYGEDAEGKFFTTITSGEVVVKKVRELVEKRLLPVDATIIKDKAYYDIL